VDDLALETAEGDRHVLFQEQNVIAKNFAANLRLLVCLGVHKGEKLAIIVQVLHFAAFDANFLHALAGVVGHVASRPGSHVADGQANGRVATPRFVVRIVEHLVDLTIFSEGCAFTHLIDVDHRLFSFSTYYGIGTAIHTWQRSDLSGVSCGNQSLACRGETSIRERRVSSLPAWITASSISNM